MAFLATKVPKIFPSKSRKGHENHLAPKEGEELRLQSPAVDCNGNGSSNDSHSNDSTLESSPTLTPREIKDPVTLVLPDLPNLAVPNKNSCNNNYHNNASSNNNDNNGIIETNAALRSMPAHDDFPPVALVSVPSDFTFPPLPPTNSSPVRCLTHAPPRNGEWDDATIESQVEQADTSDDTEPSTSSLSQHDHNQQDAAVAQASAMMKPWIERAARLALLQTMANEKLAGERRLQTKANAKSFANLVLLQRARTRQATMQQAKDTTHRTLLASLEKEQNTAARAALPTPMDDDDDDDKAGLECAPRIVKWHMVRK